MNSLNEHLFFVVNNISIHGGIFNAINVYVATYSPYIYAFVLLVSYLLGKKSHSLYAFYSAIIGLCIDFVIGIFYYHPRPFMLGLGHQLIYHINDTSFPSDHATLAFSIALAFLLFRDTVLGVIMFLFAIWVGFARVYVGVHFPFDIFGSFLVSLLSVVVIFLFKKQLERLNVFLVGIEVFLIKNFRFLIRKF